MGKFRIAKFLAAVLPLAGIGNVFAEASLHCMFNAKECEDYADSSTIYQVPDSINTTLQVELDRDTSFVFFGSIKKFDIEAYLSPYHQHEPFLLERESKSRQAQTGQPPDAKYGNTAFGDNISEEDKERFVAWAMPHIDTINARLESVPKDLQTTFRAVAPDIDYALLKFTYDVKKVYDRSTRKWVVPADSQKAYTRQILVRRGAFVVTDPIGLRANRSAIRTNSQYDRIYTSNGNSTIVDEKKLDSLDAFASRHGTFVPQAFEVEVIKNMSQIYMNRIQIALAEGNKDVLRKTVDLLDSFSVRAEGAFVIGPVLNLSCQTRQFMNFYLGTYDDNLHNDLNCLSTSLDRRSNDGQIFVMLRDSVMAMQQSGELEKNLANLPSGDRAFWRIITAALSTSDQNKLNELIKANADSIKKINQRDFVIEKYYKEPTLGNLTAQVGMGVGPSFSLGDAHNYFPIDVTPYLWLEFTYRGFDFGYALHSMPSDNLTDSTFANAMFMDFLFGYRTFRTSHFEHRIMAGPSVIFTDIRLRDPPNSKDGELEEETLLRYNVSTSLDFYFSGIKVDDPNDERTMRKGHGRLGLRLLVGYTGYATELLKNSDGGNFYATLSLVFQGYGSRLKKYGE